MEYDMIYTPEDIENLHITDKEYTDILGFQADTIKMKENGYRPRKYSSRPKPKNHSVIHVFDGWWFVEYYDIHPYIIYLKNQSIWSYADNIQAKKEIL